MMSSCASNGNEPAPRRCRPGTINLRSSMPKPCRFSDRNLTVLDSYTTRMPAGMRGRQSPKLRFGRPVTLGAFICGSFFAEAPDINKLLFIKLIHLSLRTLRSLR